LTARGELAEVRLVRGRHLAAVMEQLTFRPVAKLTVPEPKSASTGIEAGLPS
jgi:hypothetical protein